MATATQTQRDDNLRALAGMSTEPTQETKLLGLIPYNPSGPGPILGSGGEHTTLSPEENAVVATIIKALGIETPTKKGQPLTAVNATQDQWKQITAAAQARLKTREKPVATKEKSEQEEAEKAIDTSPWTKESEDLASTLAGQLAPIEQQISGSQTAADNSASINQALGDVAGAGGTVTPGSSAWLQQNLSAEQAASAPLQAAETAYAKAYASSAVPVEQALVAGGTGAAQEVATAPYETLLKALASHNQYETTYEGGALPGSETLPAWLNYYAKQSGVTLPSTTASKSLAKSGTLSTTTSASLPESPPGTPTNPNS